MLIRRCYRHRRYHTSKQSTERMTVNYRSDWVYLLEQEWSNLNDILYQALVI